jgi:predicted amidohydrolase
MVWLTEKWLLGIVQNKVQDDKKANIAAARQMIVQAAGKGAAVVALPEMFNCPYNSELFPGYAEQYPDGESIAMLSATAAAQKIYLFGGSIPEKDGNQIFNTCFIFGPDGRLLARHRKIHLFDVELEEGLTFRESATLERGNQITVVDTRFGKIGVVICYDLRFPELARAMALRGVTLLLAPAAFNMITGPAHWELTLRLRAVDNQFYVAGVAPARNEQTEYLAYGHSMLVDPWGKIVKSLDAGEGLFVAEIDIKRLERVRSELPLLKHRRTDLYELREL